MNTTNVARALVVGLGISGIATAVAIAEQVGWTPMIVERAQARRTGGYFVALFGGGTSAARGWAFWSGCQPPTRRRQQFEIDRAGNRKLGLGYGDLPGRPWMMRAR